MNKMKCTPKFVERLPARSDFDETERMMQEYGKGARRIMGWSQEQAKIMECGIRWAVEARREGRGAEKEQRKKVRFAGEQLSKETRTQITHEQDMMDGPAEIRTGRGSAGLA